MKKGVIILSVWMLAVTAKAQVFSQPERKETRTGNTQFDKGQYAEAEGSYKKALDKKNNMPEATFNLGDAVYQQKKWDDAIKQFQLSAQTNPDPLVKAKAYHNLGNTYLEQKKWDEAIAAYKNALKNNPNDKDTKYNLAYANAMKPKQQNDGGGQDNKDDKKEQDKDKQDQKNKPDDKQDNKDEQNKDQQAKDGDKKDQKDKPQQGQQPKISKEDAEKLMQALMNEEQKTAQKMQEKQAKPVNVKIAKDW